MAREIKEMKAGEEIEFVSDVESFETLRKNIEGEDYRFKCFDGLADSPAFAPYDGGRVYEYTNGEGKRMWFIATKEEVEKDESR